MAREELWRAVCRQLEAQGVDLADLDCGPKDQPRVKVVCVDASMRDSLIALGESPRDQVVMVRLDSTSLAKLDAWVETGALKSRSEAAALFIREGLAVRDAELRELEEAIHKVEAAKRQLRTKAEDVLGSSD